MQCEDPPPRSTSPLVILNQTPRICSQFSNSTAENWSSVFVGKFFEFIGTESVLVSALSARILAPIVQRSEAIHHAISALGASLAIGSCQESRPDITHQIKDHASRAYEAAYGSLRSYINTLGRPSSNKVLICALVLSVFEVGTSIAIRVSTFKTPLAFKTPLV